MALTPAEKQRRYRERQKQKTAGLAPEAPKPPKLNLPETGLSNFITSQDEEEAPFAVGYIWEELRNLDLDYLLEGTDPDSEIARTEKAIEHITLALRTLTGVLNEFRKHQIDEEIARTKKEDLSDPAKQDEALARIVRLTEVRKQLDKKFRLDLNEFEVPVE